MQPRGLPAKPKYKIKDFAAAGNPAANKGTFIMNDPNCKLFCICKQFNQDKAKKCSRCNQSYHNCVTNKSQSVQNWQCLHCQSQIMDPIFFPQQILIQNFFKTELVTQYFNYFEFIFFLTPQQLKKPVEVRILQDSRNGLAWPMQGQFYLNKQPNSESIFDIKPLLKNSNRKNRKQQPFILPQDKLKVGKNILIFSIPKINGPLFEARYQIQLRGTYFIGIYSIKKFSKQQLIQKTYQTSKIDKAKSLQLLKTFVGQGQICLQKIKLCLECPYMKSRIKIPIRGKKCTHYTCICLDTLIQTRTGMSSRQWQCPICNSDINQPIIDLFILSILNDGSAGIEVILDPQGNYQWVAFEDDNLSLSSDSLSEKIKPKPKQFQQHKDQIQKGTQQRNKQKSVSALQSKPAIIQNVIQIPQIEQIIVPKQKIPEKQATISKKTQKQQNKQQKNIVPINLDDEDDQPIRAQPKKIVTPLQIMIPVQKTKADKQKKLLQLKQQLKQNLIKQKQKKPKLIQPETQKIPVKKTTYFITDIEELDFRPLGFNQYVKKYFNLQYNRAKINDDLKIIFKQVL